METKNHRLLLGAHMSIAGGLQKAIERGASINCTTIQIFTKSNRQWRAKPITPENAQLFKQKAKEFNIEPIVAHATYLINIGSPNDEVRNKSIEALAIELDRCHQLNIPYLILHPGSCGKITEQQCLDRVINALDSIFKQAKNNTMILLETMAGQGSSICYTFEHLAYIINNSKHKKKLGICFDTCHTFVAGYDFRDKKSYESMWEQLDKIVGLEKLKVIHLNDSKKELGSRVDRHEEIGQGKLGLEPFRLLFNDPRFFDIPKILETPRDELADYARNMATIQTLLNKETKKILGIEEKSK